MLWLARRRAETYRILRTLSSSKGISSTSLQLLQLASLLVIVLCMLGTFSLHLPLSNHALGARHLLHTVSITTLSVMPIVRSTSSSLSRSLTYASFYKQEYPTPPPSLPPLLSSHIMTPSSWPCNSKPMYPHPPIS